MVVPRGFVRVGMYWPCGLSSPCPGMSEVALYCQILGYGCRQVVDSASLTMALTEGPSYFFWEIVKGSDWSNFTFKFLLRTWLGFPGGSDGKESACNVGALDSVPGLGRSPGEENTHSSSLPGESHGQEATVHGSQRVGHDWVTNTFTFKNMCICLSWWIEYH